MTDKTKATIWVIVGAVAIAGIVYVFAYEPPLFQGDTATSTASSTEPIIPPEPYVKPIEYPALPITQIEDEWIEGKDQYNLDGLLVSQVLEAEDVKLKKDKLSDIKEDLLPVQLEDTKLPEAEVLTLYVRGKGEGTAILKIGDDEIITLTLEKKGWLTKWDSATGWWTRGQINNAYVEFTGDIKVSNLQLYAEDQHSLVDNFDSYNDGDLTGQGSWSGDTSFDIQGTTVQTGAKAVQIAGSLSGDQSIEKSFRAEADGSQIWYNRTNNTGVTAFTRFFEGTTETIRIRFQLDGNIYYYTAGDYVELQAYVANTWYKMEVEWQTSDNTFRIRVDDGGWTGWIACINAFTNVDKVQMLSNAALDAGEISYWDSFGGESPPPAVEEAVDSTIIQNWEE